MSNWQDTFPRNAVRRLRVILPDSVGVAYVYLQPCAGHNYEQWLGWGALYKGHRVERKSTAVEALREAVAEERLYGSPEWPCYDPIIGGRYWLELDAVTDTQFYGETQDAEVTR